MLYSCLGRFLHTGSPFRECDTVKLSVEMRVYTNGDNSLHGTLIESCFIGGE